MNEPEQTATLKIGETTKIRPQPLLIDDEPPIRNAYLTVLNGTFVGRTYRLVNGRLMLGRAPDCDVVLDDDGVSRRHALFVVDSDGKVTLEDLGSTNGSLVNGVAQTVVELHGGERLSFGSDTLFKFEFRDSIEERYATHLYESATQDHLTGVYNERFLRDQLRVEFAWHKRHQRPLAVIFLDVDRFKYINDRYGHLSGDRILRKIAERCQQLARAEDVFARYGGEEFVCLLRDTPLSEAADLAERMRACVATQQFRFGDAANPQATNVTISAGVAEIRSGLELPEQLLALADERLYLAKKLGRNRVVSTSD